MDFLLLGAGGVGSAAARQMARDPGVGRLVVADAQPDRARGLAKEVGAEALVLHATATVDFQAALKGVDAVVNAAHASLDLPLMEAALLEGVHYMDLSSVPEQQLPLSDQWEDAGLLALLGAGEDPGISNVMARYAADGMEEVRSIRLRDGDTVASCDHPLPAVWSPGTFLREVLSPGLLWEGSQLRSVPPLSGREVYPFPEPVGPQPVYLMEHEEPVTLPRFIGKGVEYVDLKLALDDATVATLRSLHALGLTSEEPVALAGGRVSPMELLIAMMPQPADLAGRVEGHAMMVAEVEGISRGRRARHRLHCGLSHGEAHRKYGSTATAYSVGTGTAIFAGLLAAGRIPHRGVIAPEVLDPLPVLTALGERGLPVTSERSVVEELP